MSCPNLSRVLVALSVAPLALLAAACGGSDAGQPHGSNLSEEERGRLLEAVGRLQEQVGFPLLSPVYIPEGLKRLPRTDRARDGNTSAYLIFSPQSGLPTPEEKPLLAALVVTENLDPDPVGCPPESENSDPAYACEEFPLDNITIAAETVPTARSELAYVVHFRAGKLYVDLEFYWQLPQTAPLQATEQMKDEALLVLRSMTPARDG